MINHPGSFWAEFGAPIDLADIDFKFDFVFDLDSLIVVLLSCYALQIVESKLCFYLTKFADHTPQIRIFVKHYLANFESKREKSLVEIEMSNIPNGFKSWRDVFIHYFFSLFRTKESPQRLIHIKIIVT
jgi:hypothetical protein